jgi:hypothetical protein
LQERTQKRLITFDESRLTRRGCELAQARLQGVRVGDFGLKPLHELQPAHEPQPLGFDVRWAWAAPVLRIEPSNPGLVKLCCFTKELLSG